MNSQSYPQLAIISATSGDGSVNMVPSNNSF
jgi:hypothetical protein